MPVMNGTEAASELRKAGYPYLIIGITGNISDGDIKEYVDCGADIVLRKPIKAEIVDKFLDFCEIIGTNSHWLNGQTIRLGSDGLPQWSD